MSESIEKLLDMSTKRFGEFKCPICKQIFFDKKKLAGHIGGKHRKNITKRTKILQCKNCHKPLIKGKNWAEWAIKQANLICTPCKNEQNRKSYYRKKEKEND
jgi:RNase P subunit RPR2